MEETTKHSGQLGVVSGQLKKIGPFPVDSGQPDGRGTLREIGVGQPKDSLSEFEKRLKGTGWTIDWRIPRSANEYLAWVTCWKNESGTDRLVVETDANGEFTLYVRPESITIKINGHAASHVVPVKLSQD